MKKLIPAYILALLSTLFLLISVPAQAGLIYWNVFNLEGESSLAADIVTYASLNDMLSDTNRTGVNSIGGFGSNIVDSGSDGSAFWNVFNLEGESSLATDIVTYASLNDMLSDTNRTGVNTIGGFGSNIVGSGSDGSAYWNVFNLEGESSLAADLVTYASLNDMLSDTNRTGVNSIGGFGSNIVGSGSDGNAYWNVFNLEGESSLAADIVTYASLNDMLSDTNRTGVNSIGGFGSNIVGSGAFIASDNPIQPVMEPSTLLLYVLGLVGLGFRKRIKSQG